MKLFNKNHLFLALSLTLCVNNTQAMEWKPSTIALSGMAIISGVLLGKIALDKLYELLKEPEEFPFSDLPEEARINIVTLIAMGATSDSLYAAVRAIRSLSLVNTELNALINDRTFTFELLKLLSERFNTTPKQVALMLYTPMAKELLSEESNRPARDLAHETPRQLNQQDINGNTILLLLLRDYNVRVFDTTQGDFFRGGYKEITAGIQKHKYISIEYILNHGADPELANIEGLSPLQAAIDTGNEKLIELVQKAINQKQEHQQWLSR